MAYSTPIQVVASAARTTTGTSGTLAVPEAGSQLSLLLNVTAASGTTPSMTVSVQWSDDGGTTWADADTADAFQAITATKVTVKAFQVRAPMYRLAWAITGTTPSFTFTALAFVTT